MAFRSALVALILCAFFGATHAAWAEEALKPGAKLESLPVAGTTYHDVQIRSVNARTVVISHTGGLSALRLRDLSAEWQARFNYSPEAEAAAEKASASAPKTSPRTTSPRAAVAVPESKLTRLLKQFGKPAKVQAEVDLRPRFFALDLNVKNQGRRPSCAVFAMVCALEFQNAELTGEVEKFSEEYLLWALLNPMRADVATAVVDNAQVSGRDEEDSDAGFSLGEVAMAMRLHGVPLQSSMPNSLGRKLREIEKPSPAVVAEAKQYRRIIVEPLPPFPIENRIANLVHALNANLPVTVGMAWPHYRTLSSGYIDAQRPLPGAAHAVTLVGYKSATGELADVVFIFKNSYGPSWGQGGYGYVTQRYLSQHLGDAAIIDVQRGDAAHSAAGAQTAAR